MNQVATDLLLAAVTALATWGATSATNRRARKTDAQRAVIEQGKLELEERREDGKAYERAAGFNKEITDQLSAQLQLMSQTLTQMRADLAAEKETSRLLRGERDELAAKNEQQAAHIAELEGQIQHMQTLINEASAPEQGETR